MDPRIRYGALMTNRRSRSVPLRSSDDLHTVIARTLALQLSAIFEDAAAGISPYPLASLHLHWDSAPSPSPVPITSTRSYSHQPTRRAAPSLTHPSGHVGSIARCAGGAVRLADTASICRVCGVAATVSAGRPRSASTVRF